MEIHNEMVDVLEYSAYLNVVVRALLWSPQRTPKKYNSSEWGTNFQQNFFVPSSLVKIWYTCLLYTSRCV